MQEQRKTAKATTSEMILEALREQIINGTLVPVSYTHLDVYKRQSITSANTRVITRTKLFFIHFPPVFDFPYKRNIFQNHCDQQSGAMTMNKIT